MARTDLDIDDRETLDGVDVVDRAAEPDDDKELCHPAARTVKTTTRGCSKPSTKRGSSSSATSARKRS